MIASVNLTNLAVGDILSWNDVADVHKIRNGIYQRNGRLISLLTDFGLRDHYAGTMKGVMLGICPEAALVDISHDVAPQDEDPVVSSALVAARSPACAVVVGRIRTDLRTRVSRFYTCDP